MTKGYCTGSFGVGSCAWVCGFGAGSGGFGAGVAGCGAFDGALAAVGIWPSKIRRRIPGVSIDKGLVLMFGWSELPVME